MTDDEMTKKDNDTLTPDERRALLFHHLKAYKAKLAVKKAADADLRNACKLARSELGDTAVAEIKDAIALETPEGEAALRAEVERKLNTARDMNVPLGHQFTFSEDMRPSTDRAFEEGKNAALQGLAMSPPHDPSVPQYESWIEGWHAGNEINLSDFRAKLKAKPPADDEGDDDDTQIDIEDAIAGAGNTVDTSDAPFHVPDEPMPNTPAIPA